MGFDSRLDDGLLSFSGRSVINSGPVTSFDYSAEHVPLNQIQRVGEGACSMGDRG